MAGQLTRLNIRVSAPVQLGQTVRVSGSSFATSAGSPEQAIPLITTPTEYPVWRTSKPIIVRRGAPHSYRYALFEGGKFVAWEAAGSTDQSPRTFEPSAANDEVVDEFRGTAAPMPAPPPPAASPSPSPSPSPPPPGAMATGSSSGSSTHSQAGAVTLSGSGKEAFVPPPESKLWIVCFHLPLRLSRTADGGWAAEWNDSLVAKSADGSIAEDMPTAWVGTVTRPSDGDDGSASATEFTEEEREAVKAVCAPFNCIPVFLAPDDLEGHYFGFCKQVMWPVFHNVDVLDIASACWKRAPDDPAETWDQAERSSWWATYQRVNKVFAEVLMSLTKSCDVIWVHDYHLMLLPRLIAEDARYTQAPGSGSAGSPRAAAAAASASGVTTAPRSIFFLHVPFPTIEIFRSLMYREELLLGFLSADVVGFHAFDHARHFLNACKRLLGLNYQSRKGGLVGVEKNGRNIMVVMSHVGLQKHTLKRELQADATQAAVAELRRRHAGKTIIAGVDVCQRLSGIALKLLAFERLLNESPDWAESVVLVQMALRSRSREQDEAYTSKEVSTLVERINEQAGRTVIEYEEVYATALTTARRLALCTVADVLLNTAIREGLNMMPLEFIYAQDLERPGVVIASELSVCSSLLNGALIVQPFDIPSVARALEEGLAMDTADRAARRERDLPFITSRPPKLWTQQILRDMWSDDSEGPLVPLSRGASMGDGGEAAISYMRTADCTAAYARSARRVILLDYGGTLVEKEQLGKYLKQTSGLLTDSDFFLRRPTPRVVEALTRLCRDPANLIFLISSSDKSNLQCAIGHISRLGLAASNGLCYSWPVDETAGEATAAAATPPATALRTWETHDYGVDWDEVCRLAMPILNRFTIHTNGSSIRRRDPGIAWSYHCTDPDWGGTQAKILIPALTKALAGHDVVCQHLKGTIEVIPKRLHKGVVVQRILQQETARHHGEAPDFILCMGNESSDEKMFTSVYSFLADGDAEAIESQRVFTCTVEKKPSNAALYVDSVQNVEDILVALAGTAGGKAGAAGAGAVAMAEG